MLRILHLPGTFSRRNGRMHVIMNIYRQIDRSKFQFDFLANDLGDESFISEIVSLGGHVYKLPKNKMNNIILLHKILHQTVKNNNYQVVHYHATSQWGAALLGLKKLQVKQVIIHSHATSYSDSYLKSIRNAIMTLPMFIEGTDFIASTYEAGKGIFFGKKFNTLLNSIDIHRFKYDENNRESIRKKLNIQSKDIVIGNVGRYSKQKNQLFILDIFNANINNNGKKWYLLLIGQGALKQQIIDKAVDLGIRDRVILIDTKLDIERYYSAMDIFCFPSTYEGFGMAALEAQANGLPVILSDVIPNTVKLENTVELSLSNSTATWADAVLAISKKNINRKQGYTIVKSAHLDSNLVVHEWEKLYSHSY